MKQILFLLPIFISFLSCGLDYEGEERVLFEGKIVDENGNPLPGIYVSAEAKLSYDGTFSPTYEDVVSYDYTDESGNFKLFFPSPTNEDEIRLYINYEDENPIYSQTIFYNIQDNDYVDQRIDFGTTVLYPVEESIMLTISVEETNEFNIKGWNLEGKIEENFINYSPEDLDTDIYFNYSSHNPVAKNQMVTLTYYYQNNFSTEVFENSVSIEIQDQPVHYEITF